ncbi:Gustatory receptor 112, partial [Halyomorpha halys]
MIGVTPHQPTISKVELVLNDIFKLSRAFGTFPINSKYSGICKVNLLKSIFIYLPLTLIAVILVCWVVNQQYKLLALKIMDMVYTISPVIFYWVHLAWMIKNMALLKEVFNELKDIEYHLWNNGVRWCYKYSWYTKYLLLVGIFFSDMTWVIINEKYQSFINIVGTNVMYYAVITVMNQYTTLIQLLQTLLRSARSIEESKTVIKLADKLSALCQSVNMLYEPHIFLYIVVIFVVSLFAIYMTILLKESLPEIIVWALLLMFPLVQIVISVGNFSHEVKKTNLVLYGRLLDNLDDEILQFHLVAKRDIVFTAAGFFTLETALICT